MLHFLNEVNIQHKSGAPANAIEYSKTCLSLPLSQWMSEEKVDLVSVAMTNAKSEEIV